MQMEAIINYLDNVKFEVNARRHRIVCDQPPENKGTDEGMTPPELMLASLGTCAGYYAAEYLRARSLPTTGLKVRVSAEKLFKPARLDSFRIEVTIPAGLGPQHEEGVMRAVKLCLIHNTLLSSPKIETVIQTQVEVPV